MRAWAVGTKFSAEMDPPLLCGLSSLLLCNQVCWLVCGHPFTHPFKKYVPVFRVGHYAESCHRDRLRPCPLAPRHLVGIEVVSQNPLVAAYEQFAVGIFWDLFSEEVGGLLGGRGT